MSTYHLNPAWEQRGREANTDLWGSVMSKTLSLSTEWNKPGSLDSKKLPELKAIKFVWKYSRSAVDKQAKGPAVF